MEIKNITKYNEELLKKFLKVYYFDKIKTVRIIMNILILIVVIRFFIKKDIDALDIITFIFALFGIIEINTNMLPVFTLLSTIFIFPSYSTLKIITYIFENKNLF